MIEIVIVRETGIVQLLTVTTARSETIVITTLVAAITETVTVTVTVKSAERKSAIGEIETSPALAGEI